MFFSISLGLGLDILSFVSCKLVDYEWTYCIQAGISWCAYLWNDFAWTELHSCLVWYMRYVDVVCFVLLCMRVRWWGVSSVFWRGSTWWRGWEARSMINSVVYNLLKRRLSWIVEVGAGCKTVAVSTSFVNDYLHRFDSPVTLPSLCFFASFLGGYYSTY